MIEFKIVGTPDKSQQSTYQHLGLTLLMGNGEGDMVIDDPGLGTLQLKVFYQGNAFYVENLNPAVEVRLNGKPIAGPQPVKERDNLNMGRTVINFVRLDTQPLTPPPEFEHPMAASKFTPGSKEKAILDSLAALEKAATPASPPPPPPKGPPGMPPPLPGGVKPPLPPVRKP